MIEFSEQARIKLAEAMGWKREPNATPGCPDNWRRPDGKLITSLDFHPLTDANDDYAVLEWARENWLSPYTGEFNKFAEWLIMGDARPWHYRVGDYARAACKALGIDLEEQE